MHDSQYKPTLRKSIREAKLRGHPFTEAERLQRGDTTMTIITSIDRTEIYYKNWGAGKRIVFSHGRPLWS